MADRLVINTGPLVTLARVDLLDLVDKLPIDFISPEEVFQEIARGVALGYPDATPDWLTSVALSSPLTIAADAALDRGEAAVIQLALDQGIQRVCIDETKGRLVAEAVGLSVTGTLGLLGRAKILGFIPALRPLIDRIMAAGAFYDDEIIQRALKNVGE